MSKSDKSKNGSPEKSLPDDLKVMEMDEAVFGRASEKFQKERKLNNFMGGMKVSKLVEQDEIDVVIEQMLDRYNFDNEEEFENRLASILGKPDDVEVSETNLQIYLAYLKKNLKIPCSLTGGEDFEWEEYYVMGRGSKKEYEKLKKTQPSSTDTFNLIGFNDYINEEDGLLVDVQRVTDNKKFTLPLSNLEVTDETSDNDELLDDYATWFVNYR